MGANLSLQRLSCGHLQRSQLTKSTQDELKTLKEKLKNAITCRKYSANELSDALKRVEMLKNMFRFVQETLQYERGKFNEISEASDNLHRLIDIEKIIENLLIALKNEKYRNAKDVKNLKVLESGDVCYDCYLKFYRNFSWSSSEWNSKDGVKNKIAENLKIITEFEIKFQNNDYSVDFRKSFFQEFDCCVFKFCKLK